MKMGRRAVPRGWGPVGLAPARRRRHPSNRCSRQRQRRDRDHESCDGPLPQAPNLRTERGQVLTC